MVQQECHSVYLLNLIILKKYINFNVFMCIYIFYKNTLKITFFGKRLSYFRKYLKPGDNAFYKNVAVTLGRGKLFELSEMVQNTEALHYLLYKVFHDQLWSETGTSILLAYGVLASKLAHKSSPGDTLRIVQTRYWSVRQSLKLNQFPRELVYREPDTIQSFLLSWNHSTHIKVKAPGFVYSIQNQKTGMCLPTV